MLTYKPFPKMCRSAHVPQALPGSADSGPSLVPADPGSGAGGGREERVAARACLAPVAVHWQEHLEMKNK